MIPINSLARGYRPVHAQAVSRVLKSGRYVLGSEVEGFEAEFADYCRAMHCVGLASGTDALEMALRAVGVMSNSEVVTAANAGGYASAATLAIGAMPRFADVDKATHVVTLDSIMSAVTPVTRAVVVTHLYGRLVDDIEAIVEWTAQQGVPVVEDCAQSAGAIRGGRRAGTYGQVGAFSFYPTKNLGAVGDAGAIVTSDARIAEETRCRRQYGWSQRYHADLPGGRNSRLDEDSGSSPADTSAGAGLAQCQAAADPRSLCGIAA